MKRKLIAAALVCTLALPFTVSCSSGGAESEPEQEPAAEQQATEQTITDMQGREVTIPTQVDAVYCAVPTGEAAVATLAPEKIVGWVNEPTEAAMEYLPEDLANMPAIGGWMGQQVTASMEDIIELAPDVIVYMGSNVMSNTDETPDQIQNDTGIPVVVVSSKLEDTAETYRNLGKWLGEEERGEELAAYCKEKLAYVEE